MSLFDVLGIASCCLLGAVIAAWVVVEYFITVGKLKLQTVGLSLQYNIIKEREKE